MKCRFCSYVAKGRYMDDTWATLRFHVADTHTQQFTAIANYIKETEQITYVLDGEGSA